MSLKTIYKIDSSNYRPFYLRRLTNNPVYGGKFSPITVRPTLRNQGRLWGKYYVTCMYDVEPTIKSSKISVFQSDKCSRINLGPEALTHVWFVGHNTTFAFERHTIFTIVRTKIPDLLLACLQATNYLFWVCWYFSNSYSNDLYELESGILSLPNFWTISFFFKYAPFNLHICQSV